MPLAPLPVMPIPSKPKMGFSIEALVGSNTSNNNTSPSPPGPGSRPGSSPCSEPGRNSHQYRSEAPVQPVPTFPASAPGGVPAAFLDSLCGGGVPRGVLYPQHHHDGGYAGVQAPFFLAGRETYPLYPWLLARHPRFLHRLPGKSKIYDFVIGYCYYSMYMVFQKESPEIL